MRTRQADWAAGMLIVSCVALASCYEDPNDLLLDDVLTVTVTAQGEALADNQAMADVVAKVNANTALNEDPAKKRLRVSISSGVINFTASDGAARRMIELEVPLQGELTLPLLLGRDPGTLIVEARIGEVVRFATIDVAPKPPDEVIVELDRAALPADGERTFNATAILRALGPSEVSLGAEVRFAACCAGTNGEPEECIGLAPFRIESSKLLDNGDRVRALGTSERIVNTSTVPERPDPDVEAWVIAEFASADEQGAPECDRRNARPVRAESPILLIPVSR